MFGEGGKVWICDDTFSLFSLLFCTMYLFTRGMIVIASLPRRRAVCVCVFYQGEEVVLQAESVHRLQAEVPDARQQTLQHGRAVLDAIEAHGAGVDL